MAEINYKNITQSSVAGQIDQAQNNGLASELGQSDNSIQEDGGYSNQIISQEVTPESITTGAMTGDSMDFFKGVSHANGLFQRNEIDLFHKRYRFGLLNPWENLSNVREYLFFTKPDLNIFPRSNEDSIGTPSMNMHEYLQTQPYWAELERSYHDVIECLQSSLNSSDPFNHLLGNMVESNLDIPSISAEMIDTPSNMYGVGYQYRGSSEASDDSFDFSLEFKDTYNLPVYHFFKAYEDYETIKHHGQLRPWHFYIRNKILYDQYSIYKFMVDMDDDNTIVYYGKFYGVKSKSLPRDVFSNTDFSNGLSYSVDFNAAFFDDMKPNIIREFNNLSYDYFMSQPFAIEDFNTRLARSDNRPARAAYVNSEYSMIHHRRVFKLRWRGDDQY